MSPEKEEQVTPLAAAAIASFRKSCGDEENPTRWQQASRRFYKKRSVRCCCCGVMAALGLVAIVLLVVAVTVYKVRDPVMTMNAIAMKQMRIVPPNVSLTIVADVSVKNRNPATFYFHGSLTSLYYRGALVGATYGPPGRAAGRRTYRMNVTLDVVSDKLLSNPALINDVQSGLLEMNSSTAVGGHVMVFGLFRHHVDVLMNCTVLVAVANQTIRRQLCWQRVWI
uniref:Late embryogenesis abundant protein LEA-2 subgroup domain-containing protein n=1 Tax=Anthurium amnicola TaxID=1678845 RepID=A0A1D1YY19_9ARAE